MLSLAYAPGIAHRDVHVDFDCANVAKKGTNIIFGFRRYVPHHTPNLFQEALLSKHFISKAPTGLFQLERSISNRNASTKLTWTFE